MATIFTVHGTFSSGPEDGHQWWQKGSTFEKDVRDYVEAEDGTPVEFKPFVWDGKNSEESRRKAAKALEKLVTPCERNGTWYCLVGHSHGGNVIRHYVEHLRSRGRYLGQWLTVGTPFTQGLFKFDFGGLDLLPRLFIISLTLLLIISLSINSYMVLVSKKLSSEPNLDRLASYALPISDAIAANIFAAAMVQFFCLLAVLLTAVVGPERLMAMILRGRLARSIRRSHLKWLPMNHILDEAILGLSTTKSINFPIFNAGGVVKAIRVTVFLILLFYLAVALFLSFLPAVCFYREDKLEEACSHFFNAANWLISPFETVNLALSNYILDTYFFDTWVSALLKSFSGAIFVSLVGLLLMLIVVYVASIFLSRSTLLIGRGVSSWLNNSTWAQIRARAWGSDQRGWVISSVAPTPSLKLGSDVRVLPAPLQDELSAIADEASARALSKLRRAVGAVGIENSNIGHSEILSNYLNWDELIHTTYFKVPRFRKLVCYAIAHFPGFRPSEKLKADPDYEKLGQWLAKIKGEAAPALASQ